MSSGLRLLSASEVQSLYREPFDGETLRRAQEILVDIRERGDDAVRDYSYQFGDIQAGESFVLSKEDLHRARSVISPDSCQVLERTAQRIKRFAEAQRRCILPLETEVDCGKAGHIVTALDCAACYAPGGRFPLPSTVLMTAVTARAAGVRKVWAISPRPAPETLAAASIAGVDGFLAIGGIQAIATCAYGYLGVPAADIIVGPGNKWVTAAKQLVSTHVAIDMHAGPSELVVLCDSSAHPAVVAADLLAQAEHDPDALPVLVTTDASLLESVNHELELQLETLPTAENARQAVANGFAVIVADVEEGIAVCDKLAPEHLEVMTEDSPGVARRLTRFGALFIGTGSAEVLGDYGVGPNHVLPTGGSARYQGGLSVATFLRQRTWLDVEADIDLMDDVAALARMEGLEAHARAIEVRRKFK